MTHKVLLTTPRFFAFEAMIREHLAEHGCEVLEHRAHDMQMKEETLLTLVPEAAGLITALEPVTARVLAAAPRLRVICAGVGYDHIDVEAATARGVTVCISAGSNHQAVAELTLGLMVAVARQVAYGDRLLRGGGWDRLVGPELWGKTLGIVGLGRVGKSVPGAPLAADRGGRARRVSGRAPHRRWATRGPERRPDPSHGRQRQRGPRADDGARPPERDAGARGRRAGRPGELAGRAASR